MTTAQAKAVYAELFVAEADRVVLVPAGLSMEVAAAFPIQSFTAHYLATSSANPHPGTPCCYTSAPAVSDCC